jgi:NADH:ubiquinone oxidoreductase subunit 5 (subunit L)/multisubunit Na+/H+ antiporter MnhA subunit
MMQTLFLLIILGYGFGALAALIRGRGATRRGLLASGATLGAAAGIALGASVMISSSPFALSMPELLPIAGIPPLNGFVSEWLLFQSLLPDVGFPQPISAALMMLAVGMLALTSGLAAAGFVKAFGVTFLAIPRSPEAEHAHEAPASMQAGMVLLVIACLALGLAPFAVLPMFGKTIAGLDDLPALVPKFSLNLSLQMPEGFAQISPTLAALGLLIVIGVVLLMMRILRTNRQRRVSASWGCGRIGQTPRMEYTATAFAEPLRRVFAELYRPNKELTIDFHPESKYFVQSIEYKSEITPWFEKALYGPFLAFLRFVARQARRLQSGSVHLYLVYVMAMLMILLLAARLM